MSIKNDGISMTMHEHQWNLTKNQCKAVNNLLKTIVFIFKLSALFKTKEFLLLQNKKHLKLLLLYLK